MAVTKTNLSELRWEKIACRYSYLSLFTSDNPRDEDPDKIISDMQTALSKEERNRVQVLPDRKEAIQKALHSARPGDFVLIAGKGHEDYQEITGIRRAFSDKKVVKTYLQTS